MTEKRKPEPRKPDYWLARRGGEYHNFAGVKCEFPTPALARMYGTPVPVYVGDPPPVPAAEREPDAIMVCHEDGSPEWSDVHPANVLSHLRPERPRRKVYLDTPGTLGWLDALYAALGWQGGTIHDAIREVKRLKGCETYYDGQCADQDVLELLEETNATLSAARDDLQRQLNELSKQKPVAWRTPRDPHGYPVESLYAAPKPATPFAAQAEQIRQEQAGMPEHKRVPPIDHASRAPDWLGKQVKKVATEQATKPDHNRVPSLRSESAPADTPKPRLDTQRRCMTRCQSDDDGDCEWQGCPQLRDNEPATTGRHCPLDDDCEPAPADTPHDLTAKYAAWESGEPAPDTPAMVEARRLIAEGWDPVDDDSVRNRIDSSRRMPVGRAVVGAMGTLMIGGGK